MIYVDMDGVLADFDLGMLDLYGDVEYSSVADQFWNQDCVTRKFFTSLMPITKGVSILSWLCTQGLSPCILTSTGGGKFHLEIAQQKLDWLAVTGFRDVPVAFALGTKSKGDFCQPGAVLIDDRQKVCDEWALRGGKAVLFDQNLSLENYTRKIAA